MTGVSLPIYWPQYVGTAGYGGLALTLRSGPRGAAEQGGAGSSGGVAGVRGAIVTAG